MTFDARKATLIGASIAEFRQAHSQAVAELLVPGSEPANVIGLAIGVKWTAGLPTGRPALLVLVTYKAEMTDLTPRDRIPPALAGVPTDVLAVGRPVAAGASSSAVDHALTRRQRPVKGGFSVGHKDVTAGTVATGVYDVLPGGGISPPSPGVGIPPGYYILSNNHILANENGASIGDPILQPGPFDGGTMPADTIATLSRFVPISLAPDIPKDKHQNVVDAAVALTPCQDLDREVHWVGRIRGWRRRSNVNVGTMVQKVGRSSGYTLGRIAAVNATIDIGYSAGRSARFHDQIITTPLSLPGDSGSLVNTLDGVAVGLLCAGSVGATVLNQIENVRAQLGVEVSEQML